MNARDAGRRETTRRCARCALVETSSVGATVAASAVATVAGGAVERSEGAASTLTRARAAGVLLLSMGLDAGRGWVPAGAAGERRGHPGRAACVPARGPS